MINLIVAQGLNREIGANNQLLWRQKADMKLFKQKTTGHTVIMGRKTFESIGKPLPNRETIVISNQTDFAKDKNVMVTNSINHILKLSQKYPSKQIFICGGAEIYNLFLPYTSTVYLTQIHHTFDNADTFFQELPDSHWKLVSDEFHQSDENNQYPYSFRIYKRKMASYQ